MAGDIIEFAPNLEFQDVVLNSNLTIDKSITIDGGDGVSAGLGGYTTIATNDASIVIGAGAAVTLKYMSISGGADGPDGNGDGTDGDDGTPGDVGGASQAGGDGEGGANGGKATVAGFVGSPALINEETLTLNHVAVTGETTGGTGSKGGDGGGGGGGGAGGDATDQHLNCGNGGHGAAGGNERIEANAAARRWPAS